MTDKEQIIQFQFHNDHLVILTDKGNMMIQMDNAEWCEVDLPNFEKDA